jgi:hypothetical protein
VKFVELKTLVENVLIVNGRETSQGVMNDLVKKFHQRVKNTLKKRFMSEDFVLPQAKVNGL